MSKKQTKPISQQLPLFALEAPVRISVWQAGVRAWMGLKADSSLSLSELFKTLTRHGLSSKTLTGYSLATADEISQQSSFTWGSAGIAAHGECLTLNISEFPNDAAESSLLDIVETNDVPHRYFLTPKAIRGMLKRAAKRKQPFHPEAEALLMAQAAALSEMEES